MALLGLVFAAWTASDAIFLDGVFSLVNFTMAMLTLLVSRKIEKNSTHFQLGFTQLEPFINILKGLLYFGVILMALFAAVKSIASGGQEMMMGVAVLYGITSTGGGFLIAYILRRFYLRTRTSLLDVESKGWLIDASLSGVVLLAFAAGYVVEQTDYWHYVDYLDPVMVIFMCLLVISLPLQILRENIMELLLLSRPERDVRQKLKEIIGIQMERVRMLEFETKFIKAGRITYIHLYILTDTSIGIDTDELRISILDACRNEKIKIVLSIESTRNHELYKKMTRLLHRRHIHHRQKSPIYSETLVSSEINRTNR